MLYFFIIHIYRPKIFQVTSKGVPKDGIAPTKLYCTNKDVDLENEQRLLELPGEEVSFNARDLWKQLPSTSVARKDMLEMIEKITPSTIKLKIGAQVVFVFKYNYSS